MAEADYFWDYIDEEEVNDIKEDLKDGNMSTAAGKIKDYLDKINNAPLNIAITGETGSGKSTFVNAIRGLGDEDEGSAPTGVVETTQTPQPYSHPNLPNVKIWDLPGIGSPNFQPDEYLQRVGFDLYDFFIIISADRFRHNDVLLAKVIQGMNKHFYFVRSKIDNSLDSEKRKKAFNKEETLKRIKKNCIDGLNNLGLESPQVFLISSYKLDSYDFPALEQTLVKELPKHKKHVLLLAIPNMSLEINRKKKEAFQATIWLVALQSAIGGAIPIPGLSIVADIALLFAEVRKYRQAFGLDDRSLENLARQTNTPVEELKSVLTSPLNTELSKGILVKLLTVLAPAAEMILEEGLRFIPIIGSVIAGSMSFAATYAFLQKSLNDIAEDASKVLMKALENEIDRD